MYELFTDRSRKVMSLAAQAARLHMATEIDVPHILHGLLAEGGGVGASALRDAGLRAETVWDRLPVGFGSPTNIPLSATARGVVELAKCVSPSHGNKYVGTEDLAVAVERVGGLAAWPVELDEIQRRVREYLGRRSSSTATRVAVAVIKPEPGRHVHFIPTSDSSGDGVFQPGVPHAAIVACVHSDRMVNLCVFDRNGHPVSRTSVPLVQPDDPAAVGYDYCRWMPFTVESERKKQQA